MKLARKLIVISSLLLAACQSLPSTEPVSEMDVIAVEGYEDPIHDQLDTEPEPYDGGSNPAATAPDDLWVRMQRNFHWENAPAGAQARIEPARARYLRQSTYFPTIANRANYYLYYIVEELQKRDMPLELALLPMVESTLNPFASSPSRAAGLWQIMPRTGKHLGLQQDWWYDGRRDVRASTQAALDYLQRLHRDFDHDWLLAVAAYNSGKGRVMRAQASNRRKGLGTDYWSLELPREGMRYVPRLLALTQLVAAPDRYGVKLPPVANSPAFEVAATGGQLDMNRAAVLAGIKPGTLRAYNPGQLRWATAPERPPQLLLPAGTRERFAHALEELSFDERVEWRHYRVKRGDSLAGIARKFDTEVALLREINGLSGTRIRAGESLMIPYGEARAASLGLAAGETRQARGYRVRRGDSLYQIAGRFRVSVDDLISWNALNPEKHLYPGQQLKLYGSNS